MKLRNVTRLGALALTLTMVTTCLLGGTLAKYTTTVSGTDTVTVARFGYETNDGNDDVEYTTETTAEIDLFDDLTTAATGTVATDGDSDLMLAPGTYGSFQIEMNALYTDVDVEMVGSTVVASATGELSTEEDAFLSYTITYTTGNTTDDEASQISPTASYTYTTASRMTVADLASDLETALDSIILQKNYVGVITVEYAWVSTDDVEDTALGMKWAGMNEDGYSSDNISDGTYTSVAAPTITLTITNVASQVMTASPSYTATSTSFTVDGVPITP